MRRMGLEAIYPKPRLSHNPQKHRIYPYLLRNVAVVRPNHVWSSDITYVPMPHGWMYLTVVMDWFSRCVLSWRLSNTLDGQFCLDALDEALCGGAPEIFNTDQGVQYTAEAFTGRLESAGVRGQHGRPRPLDGQRIRGAIVADGEVRAHLSSRPRDAACLAVGLGDWFLFYNEERIHSALDYQHSAGGVSRSGMRPPKCHRNDSNCSEQIWKTNMYS